MAMLSRKGGIAFFSGLGVIVMAVALLGFHVKTVDSGEVPPLTDSHCVHCHPQQPATIEARGAKHKTAVGCQNCHVEHPPLGVHRVSHVTSSRVKR
jgi:hypothetical protein